MTGATAIGATLAGCLGTRIDEWEMDGKLPVSTATQYQGPNCDCCDIYAEYLQDHLESELDTVVRDDLTAVKEERGIDVALRSCHTVELDGYIVEGHIPVEIIATLLDDEPDIAGIALPGMPAGSPGMGGTKDRTWTIYAIQPGGDPAVYTDL